MRSVPEFPVLDDHVEQALAFDTELLQPGNESEAVEAVMATVEPHPEAVKWPQVWALNPQQIERFRRDFKAPTPQRYAPYAEHSLTRYGLLQLVMAASIGHPYGLADQRDGVVVQDVFPREDALDRPNSSFGAKRNFNFHTDQAYNPNPGQVPDFTVLSCVRNPEKAATWVVHLPDILRYLDEDIARELQKSEFDFFTGPPEENAGVHTGPVLAGTEEAPVIRLGTNVQGKTPAAGAALFHLDFLMKEIARPIRLQPGETLVFPNKTTPHARSEFTPRIAPETRRWLQRIFVQSQAQNR